MTKNEFEDFIKQTKAKKGVVCFAHRGVSSLAPGCSIKAISLGFETPEVDGIEFDVQKTSDGKLVVHHNFALRLGEQEAWLRDLSLSQIRKHFPPSQLPELEDVLILFKNKDKIADVEIKGFGIAKEIMDLSKNLGVYKSCVFTSIYDSINEEIKEYDPNAARIFGYPHDRGKNLAMKKWAQPLVKLAVVYLRYSLPHKLPLILKSCGTPFISLYHKLITKDAVSLIHKDGGYCIGATINLQNDTLNRESLNSMKHMKDCGVDVIKTDYPQLISGI